ncbi:MAG: hypothetical protein JOY83_05480 [Alphaproteobacteria bacterium]|nr:hypothetical protein [Alphaproteobacteria bacterium]
MAGLLNFSTALWYLGSFTLSARQTVEYIIVYPGGGRVTSFNAIDTGLALNQRFSYQTTGTVVHGVNLDVLPDDTTYFVTVTNESDFVGEFFFVLEALYT